MSLTTEQKIELQVQKRIRQAEDELVTWIQSALDSCKYGKSGKEKLEESQFRNLVSVADTTDSPEVVKNFLRYQVGRDEKWGRGKDSLAAKIIEDIDTKIKTTAQKISRDVQYDDFKVVWMELIRRYLGYGARYLTYKLKGEI
jgi:hypothetical protein